jgi:hypothetical protein
VLWERDGFLVGSENKIEFDGKDPALTTYPNLEEI